MGIRAKNKDIAVVYVNGKEIETVYVNNEQVWEKTAPQGIWTNAWSGNAIITDFDAASVQGGRYEYLYTFTGMTNSALSRYCVQADASYYEVVNNNHSLTRTLTAQKDNYKKSTNLPWQTNGHVGGTLSELIYSGSSTSIKATCTAAQVWGTTIIGYFAVTNLWYYNTDGNG